MAFNTIYTNSIAAQSDIINRKPTPHAKKEESGEKRKTDNRRKFKYI